MTDISGYLEISSEISRYIAIYFDISRYIGDIFDDISGYFFDIWKKWPQYIADISRYISDISKYIIKNTIYRSILRYIMRFLHFDICHYIKSRYINEDISTYGDISATYLLFWYVWSYHFLWYIDKYTIFSKYIIDISVIYQQYTKNKIFFPKHKNIDISSNIIFIEIHGKNIRMIYYDIS